MALLEFLSNFLIGYGKEWEIKELDGSRTLMISFLSLVEFWEAWGRLTTFHY